MLRKPRLRQAAKRWAKSKQCKNMDDRIKYYQICKIYEKKGLKFGRNQGQEYMIFYEKFDDDNCFKIVWRQIGHGGEYEEESIVEITFEEYNNL